MPCVSTGILDRLLDGVIQNGPVACILLLCIWYLIRQGDKAKADFTTAVAALNTTIKEKDTKNEKLEGALFQLVEKQAETLGLVRDRLRQIVDALRLKNVLRDTGRGDEG